MYTFTFSVKYKPEADDNYKNWVWILQEILLC